MAREPAPRRGRPSTESIAQLELLAYKGETKRSVITVAPIVHKLAAIAARCDQRLADRFESEIYAELIRLLRRQSVPFSL